MQLKYKAIKIAPQGVEIFDGILPVRLAAALVQY
jgi:hypothetical protein